MLDDAYRDVDLVDLYDLDNPAGAPKSAGGFFVSKRPWTEAHHADRGQAGGCVTSSSEVTGKPRSFHPSRPSASGCTRTTPSLRRASATRALVASLGHVQ